MRHFTLILLSFVFAPMAVLAQPRSAQKFLQRHVGGKAIVNQKHARAAVRKAPTRANDKLTYAQRENWYSYDDGQWFYHYTNTHVRDLNNNILVQITGDGEQWEKMICEYNSNNYETLRLTYTSTDSITWTEAEKSRSSMIQSLQTT